MTVHVDASVPREWERRFIGHNVWARSNSSPDTKAADWVELVDHVIQSRGDGMDSPCLIIRTGQGFAWCFAAHSLYIQGVNQDECTHRPDITPNWWEWNPPSETPPSVRKVADIEGLVRDLAVKESEVLGQFALFAI